MICVYALINDGLVVNTIFAAPAFIPTVAPDYDAVLRIDDNAQRPGVGWSYADGVYTPPPDPPTEG
jgi:hypothetical protein